MDRSSQANALLGDVEGGGGIGTNCYWWQSASRRKDGSQQPSQPNAVVCLASCLIC